MKRSFLCLAGITLLLLFVPIRTQEHSSTLEEESWVNCTVILEGEEIECDGAIFHDEHIIPPGSPTFILYVFISLFLVLFAGLMSGLTIGLMSLDEMNLEIIKNSSETSPKEKDYARKIIPLIKDPHFLLVTLLLSNAAAMEALPIFIDRISTPYAAIIVSVTMVLFFGEIIPQSLCKKFGLAIGAHSYWIVRTLQVLLFLIAWPVGKLLDLLLGTEHGTRFKRSELKELVKLHGEDKEGPLSVDEATIIKGALDLRNKTVHNCMTPLHRVFMIEFDQRLDKAILTEISKRGHSRIPVYHTARQNIKGILLTKSLLFVDMDHAPPVSNFELREIPSVSMNGDLYQLLNLFQTGKSHMAAVVNPETKEVVGVVTLEDIIEELIQEEILDEEDLADVYSKQAMELMAMAKKYQKGLRNSTVGLSFDLGPSNSPPLSRAINIDDSTNNNNNNNNIIITSNGHHIVDLETVPLDTFVGEESEESTHLRAQDEEERELASVLTKQELDNSDDYTKLL